MVEGRNGRLWNWPARTGLGLSCLMMITALASAQPLPVPRPGPPPALRPSSEPPQTKDPLGALLDRQLAPRSQEPVVIGLALSEDAKQSRFTVELSDSIDVHVFTLTNPNRVIIDMSEVLWRVSDAAHPSGRAAVKAYRYGLFRPGNSRFVIDLNKPMRVDPPRILPPDGGMGFRLVIDLAPTTAEAFAAHAGWPKGEGAPVAAAGPPAEPLAANGKRVVVVDAGHGGIDPGTHGANGLLEKDIVLAVALRLRADLEATGRYKVRLTRDKDVFVPLRERVNIARAAHADLFVSLHADSNDHREIRGASVYTLSADASDTEAAKLAEKENMSDAIAGIDLSDEDSPVASILIDLAQRDTMNRSVRFAETVLSSLPNATMVRPSSPHRSAGFAVLKAPDIPAALIELGYLTNPRDQVEMAMAAWRGDVAKAVAAAIDRHFAGAALPAPRQAANP
jgi:N-acetylmuramoyl-L-alanine amidase